MIAREDPESITQPMCDKAKGGRKHLMIAIGYLSDMSCYIDLTIDEARRRYLETSETFEGTSITIFGFDDEFNAYEISKKD